MGYGDVGARYRAPTRYAHRLSFMAHNAPIPNGLYVRHRCDQMTCVNPDHLIVGTQADNIGDAVRRDRMQRGDRHYRAKLNDSKARDIRRLSSIGATSTALARQFEVTTGTISALLSGRTWRRA